MSDLTPSRSGIAAEHSEIIEGLENIYGILVDSGYVQNTDVQIPPHGVPKDPVNVAGLRAVGMDPQSIELIGRSPCFTDEIIIEHQKRSNTKDAIPIAPSSSAISYLVGSDFSSGVRETDSGNGELLPAWALRIARATSPSGFNMAYDLNTSKLSAMASNPSALTCLQKQ